MPLPRMTTRRWMIAVAAVAVILSPLGLRFEYQKRAIFHSQKSTEVFREFHRYGQKLGAISTKRPTIVDKKKLENDPGAQRLSRLFSYHMKLWLKYEHAARHPWLPVTPDPSEPE